MPYHNILSHCCLGMYHFLLGRHMYEGHSIIGLVFSISVITNQDPFQIEWGIGRLGDWVAHQTHLFSWQNQHITGGCIFWICSLFLLYSNRIPYPETILWFMYYFFPLAVVYPGVHPDKQWMVKHITWYSWIKNIFIIKNGEMGQSIMFLHCKHEIWT